MRVKLIKAVIGLTKRATFPPRHLSTCKRIAHMPSPLSQLVGTHGAPLCTRSLLPAKTPSFTIIAMRLHLAAVLGKRRKKKFDDCSGRTKRRKEGFNKCRCPPPPPKCRPGTTKPKSDRKRKDKKCKKKRSKSKHR